MRYIFIFDTGGIVATVYSENVPVGFSLSFEPLSDCLGISGVNLKSIVFFKKIKIQGGFKDLITYVIGFKALHTGTLHLLLPLQIHTLDTQ